MSRQDAIITPLDKKLVVARFHFNECHSFISTEVACKIMEFSTGRSAARNLSEFLTHLIQDFGIEDSVKKRKLLSKIVRECAGNQPDKGYRADFDYIRLYNIMLVASTRPHLILANMTLLDSQKLDNLNSFLANACAFESAETNRLVAESINAACKIAKKLIRGEDITDLERQRLIPLLHQICDQENRWGKTHDYYRNLESQHRSNNNPHGKSSERRITLAAIQAVASGKSISALIED